MQPPPHSMSCSIFIEYWRTNVLPLLLNSGIFADMAQCLASDDVWIPRTVHRVLILSYQILSAYFFFQCRSQAISLLMQMDIPSFPSLKNEKNQSTIDKKDKCRISWLQLCSKNFVHQFGNSQSLRLSDPGIVTLHPTCLIFFQI